MGAGRNRVADILKPVVMPNTVAEAVEAIAKVGRKDPDIFVVFVRKLSILLC